MKKNIVIKLFGGLFIVSFFVLLFMRVNTNIYVWNYSGSSTPIDIQLKIDDKLIFKDSLRSSSFFPTIICKKLRYGVHKIDVLSKKADINQKSKMYRINDEFYQLPENIGERACGINKNAKDFVKELRDMLLK